MTGGKAWRYNALMNDQRRFWRLFSACLALVFMLSLLSETADARRRRRRTRRVREPAEKVLYERMGGNAKLKLSAEAVASAVFKNSTLVGALQIPAGSKSETLFRRQVGDWLCWLADGPCPSAKELMEVYPPLKADSEVFFQFAEAMLAGLNQTEVREREKNEMMARLGESRSAETVSN